MKRAVLVLCVVATHARAQPAGFTKEFQAGVDAYRLGKYDDARKHLTAAAKLDPKLPGPHRFLAAVAQAQQSWDECITEARTAIELNPRSTELPDTIKVHDECRVSAGRPPYRGELADSAAIAVVTNVPGASVKINGLTYGGTPMAPRPITAGTLDIEIDKPGWKAHKASVNAIAGIVTDVVVDLEADPNAQTSVEIIAHPEVKKQATLAIQAPPGATIVVDGKPWTATAPSEVTPGTFTIEVTAPASDPWRRRVRVNKGQQRRITAEPVPTAHRESGERAGLYVLGGGGVLLAGGFVFAMLSRDAASEARDIVRIERSRDPSAPLGETADIAPVRTRADLDDARDRASRWALISNITYAAGLATAGVGAYLLYRNARERTDVPPPFAIAPTRGGLFVAKELAW